MTKEDLDELIGILEENSEEKLIMLYNKIGINCTTINLETNKQLGKEIEKNEEVLNYLKTQYKEWVRKFLRLFEQESNLEDLLENADYYGLEQIDIERLIEQVTNEETLENVMDNLKKYKLQKYDIVNIITNGKNPVLAKIVIDNLDKYRLYTRDIIRIVTETKEPEFAKKVIENQEKYGLKPDDIINIVLELDNKELKNLITNNYEKYGLNKEQLFRIIMIANDQELSETVLSNYENYNLTIDDIRNYRINFMSLDFIKNNLSTLLKIENATEKEEIILDMYRENKDILKTVSFDILDNKILNILGKDKVNLISCYPDVVNSIIKLNNRQLKMLGKSIDSYINEEQSEEWTYLAGRILNNIDSYKELIDEIAEDNNIDIRKINSIIIHPNNFEIKTKDDVINYEQIRLKKCEEQIKSENIENKRDAVIQKIFGISIEEARKEIQKFGEDIESIQDEELKAYIKSLKEVINLVEPDLLEEIFNKVNSVESVNLILIEKKLKNEYCKMYNEGLFKVENATPIDGQFNMYDAGTEFKMIITSIGAFVDNKLENYYEDWNRSSISSQHFCASYIRNDMMGHADIPHICYGFSEMAEDSLLLSSNEDILSSITEFTPTGHGEKYYSPNKQINKTYTYNEMDFKRIQNGERKQPDYIVVFKRNGKMENLEESQKASKEFNGLPIVVIDVDKCLEAEKQKVFELEKKYQETKNPEIAQEIYQKIKNNSVIDSNFCEEIDFEQLYEETQLQEKVHDDDLEAIYSEIDAKDRKEETEKLHHIYIEIEDILSTNTEHLK